ncbi:hypothetical protein CPB84DRAFT_1749668 [Gymnopilus junonius]|uniref:Uncharacterized protein n=1 Tax=Gymnopilus junonius TaxID=109634 RepID=A0A9P5NH32_GYMJU|nr:hypothetical protein CPB84DRAFT_1749668 [Gymnopilus junonius]
MIPWVGKVPAAPHPQLDLATRGYTQSMAGNLATTVCIFDTTGNSTSTESKSKTIGWRGVNDDSMGRTLGTVGDGDGVVWRFTGREEPLSESPTYTILQGLSHHPIQSIWQHDFQVAMEEIAATMSRGRLIAYGQESVDGPNIKSKFSVWEATNAGTRVPALQDDGLLNEQVDDDALRDTRNDAKHVNSKKIDFLLNYKQPAIDEAPNSPVMKLKAYREAEGSRITLKSMNFMDKKERFNNNSPAHLLMFPAPPPPASSSIPSISSSSILVLLAGL